MATLLCNFDAWKTTLKFDFLKILAEKGWNAAYPDSRTG